jgi:hypothetical protein
MNRLLKNWNIGKRRKKERKKNELPKWKATNKPLTTPKDRLDFDYRAS